jgi:hypothetical protein
MLHLANYPRLFESPKVTVLPCDVHSFPPLVSHVRPFLNSPRRQSVQVDWLWIFSKDRNFLVAVKPRLPGSCCGQLLFERRHSATFWLAGNRQPRSFLVHRAVPSIVENASHDVAGTIVSAADGARSRNRFCYETIHSRKLQSQLAIHCFIVFHRVGFESSGYSMSLP